jgi:hypothetical protein
MAAIDARLGVTTRRSAGAPATSAVDFSAVLEALGGTDPVATLGPLGAQPTAADLTSAAEGYVGIPYVWGGTDPATGLDCSGFTQHLMRRLGVELPRVSADQLRTGTPVPDLASARPGDLLGWDTGPRNVGADHVALYLGNGMMAEAPGTGGKVQIVPVGRVPDQIRRVLTSGSAPAAPPAAAGQLGAARTAAPYADLFAQAGAKHGIDPTLLALVAERESGFDPTAVSPAGAQGLMQLMPGTARGLGVTDAFDPAQAVDGAARLLRGNLDAFGSVDKALAAYNAGGGNVRRYDGVPPFPETQRYVQWITARYGGDGRWT